MCSAVCIKARHTSVGKITLSGGYTSVGEVTQSECVSVGEVSLSDCTSVGEVTLSDCTSVGEVTLLGCIKLSDCRRGYSARLHVSMLGYLASIPPNDTIYWSPS